MVERVSGTNTTQYLHRDQQNSITKITTSGGSVTESLAYDAWVSMPCMSVPRTT